MSNSVQFSVFKEKGIEKLGFDYIPSKFPHREEQIKKIVDFFRFTFTNPGVLSKRILIIGSNGTGKTSSAKMAGMSLEKIAKNKSLNFVYTHINCRTTNSKFGLVQNILRQSSPSLPLRGYSAVELLHALWDYMIEHDRYLLLTLDEVDYYIKTTGEDIIYELTRMTDAVRNVSQRINFMFIARDHFFMNNMSKETLSTFRPQERLKFHPYLINQLYDILRNRVNEAFKAGTVTDELLLFISEYANKFGGGDARYAILILLSAGLIADREMSSTVMPEHIREAQEYSDPQIRDEDIILLSKDEKYVLLALVRCLNINSNAIYIPMVDVEFTYQSICEEYAVPVVGSVLFQRLVKDLNVAGILNLNNDFELGLSGVKSKVLETFLKKLLNRT